MPYYIETRTYATATSLFDGLTPIPHLHSHLEMVYMSEGSTVAALDYKDFLIEEGDLFLSFPSQIHFYHDQGPCRGYLFIFPHDLFKDLKELFQSNVPSCPIVKREALPPEIRSSLEKIMTKNNSDSHFDRIAAKGYLLALLGEILPRMPLIPKPSGHDSIKNILAYCSDKYTEPLNLDILSRDLHLNKYYISHIFKERIGISFPDFVNSLRIEHACGMLEKDSNITDVAFSSGFSSIRTFNRAFIKNMGMSPREYVRMKQ